MYLQTVLHNLALLYGDIVEPEDEEDHDDIPEPHNFETRAGENMWDIVSAMCLLQTFMCLFSISTTTCKTFKHFTIHVVSFPFLAKFHFMFTITYTFFCCSFITFVVG